MTTPDYHLWNVFDDDMTLRGVCWARNIGEAIGEVAGWHETGRTKGWVAFVTVRPQNPQSLQ